MCIGCGICVEECPVDAIVMEDEMAEIYMNDCIHCGSATMYAIRSSEA